MLACDDHAILVVAPVRGGGSVCWARGLAFPAWPIRAPICPIACGRLGRAFSDHGAALPTD